MMKKYYLQLLELQRSTRSGQKRLTQEPATPSSSISRFVETKDLVSEENVHQIVVEAVNRLGGIKKATPEAVLDELASHEWLNLFDVYKHLEMLKTSTSYEGKNTWIGSTSGKKPERKQLGVLDQKSSLSTGNKDVVRKKFLNKLQDMALSADEIKYHLEGEKKMWHFCTLFTQNHEFEKDTLIQQWISGGFLKGEHKYSIGDFYFRILLSNDYITKATTWSPNAKDIYKVNTNKLKEDNSTMLHKKFSLLKNLHHHKASKEVQYVSLVVDGIDEVSLERLKEFKDLKALLLLSEDVSSISKIPRNVFAALKHMEVLDLSRTNISELPNSIGNMIELKYLDLSFTLIELLPETLECLLKLETLKLKECRRLFRLPEGMKKLRSLKHLELDVLGQLSLLPRGMGELTELETLSAYLVHKDDGRSIEELKEMNKLKGSFCISRLENVVHPSEVKKAALFKKKHLKELELRWSDLHQSSNKQIHQDEILQALSPNSSLEQLQISCYGGTSFPSWIGDPTLENLTSITLFKCDNSDVLPSLGQLPSLKYLSLVEMNNVIEIGKKFRGFDSTSVAFPSLERFTIVGLSKLEMWKEVEKRDYPSLQKLTIERCSNLVAIPSSLFMQLYSLKHVEVINCRKLAALPDYILSISLVTLVIEECPLITKWFRKHQDKDRLNTQLVQNLWIDREQVTNLGLDLARDTLVF
ncbi:putative disease resistance RPP13-like protein 1 isoform X1 [Beta vulgaris subsp. vulgaris]|uniref:putative disease resistance RPP13-like protein 1 isoform X1 n=2 Tax=Beta vulgaris subsp. vulgaris TaxID=3555 RepID=UPI002036CFD1|nr:putative disease resistance RPP13-like protein 1 isoform X1 [Beta vulgaris subsp. vulgaris]